MGDGSSSGGWNRLLLWSICFITRGVIEIQIEFISSGLYIIVDILLIVGGMLLWMISQWLYNPIYTRQLIKSCSDKKYGEHIRTLNISAKIPNFSERGYEIYCSDSEKFSRILLAIRMTSSLLTSIGFIQLFWIISNNTAIVAIWLAFSLLVVGNAWVFPKNIDRELSKQIEEWNEPIDNISE